MQKKVMAVAVAAALAAPAVVLAQGSSVQIYGGLSVSFEGAEAKGADTSGAPIGAGSSIRGGNLGGAYATTNVNEDWRTRTQAAGSNLGVRGREDLGNGLYMGFQAEMSIAMGGVTPESPGGNGVKAAWRNSGVWLGGRWGEVGLGLWDLPFNLNQTLGAAHAPYANASTSMAAGLLGGGLSSGPGTISGQDHGQFCGASALGATTSTCFQDALSFHRRQQNQIWYQSPTWAGFRGRVSYGATSGATGNASNDGAPFPGDIKPYLWGVGASYTLGGLYAGVGYEYHKDYITSNGRLMGANIGTNGVALASTAATGCSTLGNGFALGGQALNLAAGLGSTLACMPTGSATAAGMSGDDANAWNVNLRYTFGFGLSIGGYYEWTKWDIDYGNTTGLEAGLVTQLKREAWRLDAAYQLGAHTFGVQYGKGNEIKGSVTSGAINAGFNSNSTSTDMWIFGYAYSLSKRSSLFAYYTMVDNDINARANGIVFNGIGPNAGGDPKYLGAGIRHLF
jgi:predicted porin